MEWFSFELARIGWARVRSMIATPKKVERLEQRIAELEERPPSVQINLAPGATYNDFRGANGEFHVHLDGKAEVISPAPVRIIELDASFAGELDGRLSAQVTKADDDG